MDVNQVFGYQRQAVIKVMHEVDNGLNGLYAEIEQAVEDLKVSQLPEGEVRYEVTRLVMALKQLLLVSQKLHPMDTSLSEAILHCDRMIDAYCSYDPEIEE